MLSCGGEMMGFALLSPSYTPRGERGGLPPAAVGVIRPAMELHRPVAFDGDPVARAGVRPVVPHGAVLGAAVVPERDRPGPPAEPAGELRPRLVAEEIVEQRRALLLRHAVEAHGMADVDVERLPSRLGMDADDRVHRDVYTDAEVFQLEMERLWSRTWIYVGHTSQIPSPGDFLTLDVAAQPVIDLLLEDESGSLTMLSDFIGKPISMQVETSYTQEQFDIVLM